MFISNTIILAFVAASGFLGATAVALPSESSLSSRACPAKRDAESSELESRAPAEVVYRNCARTSMS